MNVPVWNVGGQDYNVKDIEARNQVAEAKAAFNDFQGDALQAIPLKGSIYVSAGSYIGGVFNPGNVALSCHYIVKGMKKVHVVRTTSAWYDIYDFVDENDNVLEYRQEGSTSRTLTLDIDVPDEAVCIVLSGGGCEEATVTGYPYDFDEIVGNTITPTKYIRGFVGTSGNVTQNETSYRSYIYDVHELKYVTIESKAFEFSLAYSLFSELAEYIPGVFGNPSTMYQKGDAGYQVSIQTNGAYYLYISCINSVNPTVTGYTSKKIPSELINNAFKNILWYGTSIPAAGYIGEGNNNAYPARVGKILHANVINKAVGSSGITCKEPDRVSASNPYGFSHDFESCSRCLTNTVEEMQWIINHYNDRSIFDYRTVESLTDEQKAQILSFSYENRLLPYLNGAQKEPDMIVIDHGFNDIVYEDDTYYDYQIELVGTKRNGWYKNGVEQVSQYIQSIEFDCSGYDYVMLNTTIGPWYDVYDLFDSNNNFLRSKEGIYAAKTFENYLIDTHDAAKIIISCGSESLCDETSVLGLPYGDPDHNLFSFRGAYGFLMNLILSYNPRMKVVMIGNYCDDEDNKYNNIAKWQEWIADHWDVPIYKQWEYYGWTNKVITTKWYWDNGIWKKGVSDHDISVRDCWLADGIHPHSDLSGNALQFMANHIGAWIKDNIWSQFQLKQ